MKCKMLESNIKAYESIKFTDKGKYIDKKEYYNNLMVMCKLLKTGIEFKKPTYKKCSFKMLMNTEYKLHYLQYQ